MKYLLIIILATLTTVFITLYPKWDKARDSKPYFFNFIINIISTFIGLFLALLFTNLESEKSEDAKTIQVLTAMKNNIERTIFITSQYISSYDSTYYNTDELTKYLCNRPLKAPSIYGTYLKSDQIVRNVNPSVYSFLSGEFEFFNEQRERVNSLCDSAFTTRRTRKQIIIYMKHLDISSNLLTFEINNIKESRSNESIVNEFDINPGLFLNSKFDKLEY